MEDLDFKDRKIIYELEKNARTSVSLIAKRTGISKQLASYKIKKLEERKIILGYNAIIDTSKLGYTTYRVYFTFQKLTKEKKDEIINYLISINEVTILLTINGRWDLGCAIMVKDLYDFYDVWSKFMGYREFIDKYQVCVYSPIYHFTREFLNPQKENLRKIYILGGMGKEDFDDFDIKILSSLAPNVRIPLSDIAEKLNKSLPFIINRIRILEKRGILQGYRPMLNWKLLGFEYYKVDVNLLSRKRDQEIFNYCKNSKFIWQLDRTIGGSDLEIELFVRNLEHFKSIIQELQDKFSDVFKNYSYFTLDNVYKETFFPL